MSQFSFMCLESAGQFFAGQILQMAAKKRTCFWLFTIGPTSGKSAHMTRVRPIGFPLASLSVLASIFCRIISLTSCLSLSALIWSFDSFNFSNLACWSFSSLALPSFDRWVVFDLFLPFFSKWLELADDAFAPLFDVDDVDGFVWSKVDWDLCVTNFALRSR